MRWLLLTLVPAAFAAGVFVGPHITTPEPPPMPPAVGLDTIVGVTVERGGVDPDRTYYVIVCEDGAKGLPTSYTFTLHHPTSRPTVIRYGLPR